jgi:predicted SAM-dependent methyltransferase
MAHQTGSLYVSWNVSMRRALKGTFARLGIPIYWLRLNVRESTSVAVRIWAHLPVQRRRLLRLTKAPAVRLNFGCGDTRYDGWVGVDQRFAPNVDLALDLRRRLPFRNGSVDLCYSEHFFEHLFPDEGQFHLNEVHRILKPGGRYRVVVPDVVKFARKYIEGDVDFFRRAFPWAERPIHALFAVANMRGDHRNIIDFEELAHLARIAGFETAQRSFANGSDLVDLRIDVATLQRIEESLYVEMIKSAEVS